MENRLDFLENFIFYVFYVLTEKQSSPTIKTYYILRIFRSNNDIRLMRFSLARIHPT